MSTRHCFLFLAAHGRRVKPDGELVHASVVRSDGLGAALACPPPCIRRSLPTPDLAVQKKWTARPPTRLTWFSCFPAPFEVAECVVVADKVDPERERRLQKVSARSGDDTVVVVVCTVLSMMYMRYVIVVSEMHLRDLASDT